MKHHRSVSKHRLWKIAHPYCYLHERVQGHEQKSSSIYRHYHSKHKGKIPDNLLDHFKVLAKCSSKFDCLTKEMLLIRQQKPELNVQSDSISAKVFI